MQVFVDGIKARLDSIKLGGVIVEFRNPHTEDSWRTCFPWEVAGRYFSPQRITKGGFRDLTRDALLGLI